MSRSAMIATGGALPRWLTIVVSVAIVFHLSTLVIKVLAAPSGPWFTPEGPSLAAPPQLGFALNEHVGRHYLRTMKMTHNYHFMSNRGSMPRAYLTVRLYDEDGTTRETLRFPDPDAGRLVRGWQDLVTRWLVDDQPIQAAQGEYIPAPNQGVPLVPIWEAAGPDRQLLLRSVPEHLIPRDRPVMKPSDWSMILVRSYARYLCRTTGAAQVEIVRHSREPIPPMALFARDLRSDTFEELQCNYGRLSK